MIARFEQCNSDRLARLLDDTLSAQEHLDVTRHLDHCPHCCEALERLAAEDVWWADTQVALRDLADTRPGSFATHAFQPLHSLDDANAADNRGGALHPFPIPPTTESKASPTRESQATADGKDPNQVAANSVSPAHVTPDYVSPDHVSPDHVSPDHVTPDHVTPDHWVMSLLSRSDDPQAMGQVEAMPIYSVVGQGGMGVVLKARDTSLHRFLAVKLLSPMLASSGAARQRFLREAQAAAAVVHPNIVPIYAVSAERKLPYLVMPFVAGGNLQQHLDASGPFPLERTLSIGLQVAEGLAAAHRQGIVHRDIKPANLMFDEGGFRVMLTDFGLARALDDASLTASGMVAGTPQFMSPEQARGRTVDHRSDIYSLGSVLYALATGRPPIRGDSTLDVLRRIEDEYPISVVELNERYPSWFQNLLELLMAKDANQRPQTSEEVIELLRACLAHARRPQRSSLPQRLRAKQNRWSAISMICILCVASFAVGAVARLNNNAAISKFFEETSNYLTGDRPQSEKSSQALEVEESVMQLRRPSPAGTGNSRETNPDELEHWDASSIESRISDSEQELNLLQTEMQEWPMSTR